MGIERAFKRFETWLEGWPNTALSIALVAAAVFILLIAWRGKAWEKAIVAAYVFFP